jgi:hypothetical protein
MRSALRLLLLTTVVVVAAATSAAAQTGYGSTVDVRAGEVERIQGVACPAGGTVTGNIDGRPAGTGTAAADGSWVVDLTVPANATPGPHSVNAVCGGIVVHVMTFNVLGASGALSRTGADVGLLAGGGVALILLGAAFVVGQRRVSAPVDA